MKAGRVKVPKKDFVGSLLSEYATLLVLILVVLAFVALRPDVFPTYVNLRNILQQVSILAVIATTQTFVLSVGDIDISVGALGSLIGVSTTTLMLQGVPVPVAILVGLVMGAAAGAMNGTFVAILGLAPMVATLGAMTAFQGASMLVAHGRTVYGFPESFSVLGNTGRVGPVPLLVIIGLAVLVLGWFVLTRTAVGRHWHAIGGNREASFLSGVRVKRLRMLAYVVSGLGAALMGILIASRIASANPTQAVPYLLPSLATVFIGMTAFQRGQANIPGTFVGVLILGVIANGLGITNVNTYVVQVVTGAVMLGAITFSQLVRKKA